MVRVGINGFGRIGRQVARILASHPDIKLVAINSRSPVDSHAYLLKYDSVHGTFPQEVSVKENSLVLNNQEIECFQHNNPSEIPWDKAGVDFVVESTGVFKGREEAARHLAKAVKKVIITAPAEDADVTIVMGVNHGQYNPEAHHVISNASCTTNCLAPVCKVLMDNFGIEKGFMTTTHAITSNQEVLDASAKKDKRRGRAAFSSIIPTSTGASKALALVIPELKGKIQGMALRVPIHDVSITDLAVELKKTVSVEEINNAFKTAAQADLKNILAVADDQLVSIDYVGSSYSAIVDPYLTGVNNNLAKIFAWYDNEWGYAQRVVDLISYIGQQLK